MTVNKKVRNATKTIVDGISFDSLLESRMYSMLKMHRIPFTMKEKVILQEGFKYGAETIREISIIPDFVVTIGAKVIRVDTKGFQTEKNAIKIKLLKKKLTDLGIQSEIHLPSNKKECEAVISHLLKELGR